MDDYERLVELDKAIELCQAKIDDQKLIVDRLGIIEEKISELKLSAYTLNKEHTQLLNEYDRLSKYDLPGMLSKFINLNVLEKQEKIAQEYLQTSLLHASVLQEIEILLYEKSILESKVNSVYSNDMQLQLLVNQKEEIIRNNNRLRLTEYSSFANRTNALNRKIKVIKTLIDDTKDILGSLESLRLAVKEIAFSINLAVGSMQKFYPTYYQSKKIKWIARKSIELKLNLTKYLNRISHHIEKDAFQEIQDKSNKYIFRYIKSLVDELKSANISNKQVDHFFKNIYILIDDSRSNLQSRMIEHRKELTQISEDKNTWVIHYKKDTT